MTTTRPAPSPLPRASGRIEVLDVLRGIAIIGTLAANIWLFADPFGPENILGSWTDAPVAETVMRALPNGKLLALLTLLFGVGLELQYRSAVRRGLSWPGRYPWRATLLFVEGLLHYVLVFEFDVLMGYALCSILVAYLVGRSEQVIRRWMIAQGVVLGSIVVAVTAALVFLPDENGGGVPRENVYADGTWLAQVAHRLELWPVFRLEVLVIVPLATGLFLAGVRLLRAGVFEDTEHGDRLRRRLMVVGFGVGVPMNVLTTMAGPDWFMVDRYVAPPIIALALLGLVTTTLHRMRSRPGPVRRGLTCVGRTALSCYVLQNVLASILCYGWGLGLAETLAGVRPWWVVGAWLGITVALMVSSALWLRRFERGPLELAWRWAHRLPWRRA